MGSKGEDVRRLQQELKDKRYYSGSVTGSFGAKTRDAVRDYQRKNKLKVDGVAGPTTQSRLFGGGGGGGSSDGSSSSVSTSTGVYRSLDIDSSGEDVVDLQQKLKDLGFYSGSITGRYGSLTKEAVRLFQKNNKISATGVATVKTQEYLFSIPTGNASLPKGGVEMLEWTYFYNLMQGSNKFSKRGDTAKLEKARSGLEMTIYLQSMGSSTHLDAEPLTKNDTKILAAWYGVADANKINYRRIPVWLRIGDKTYAASLYGEGHGVEYVKDNDFNGQFCVHMLGSRTSGSRLVDAQHQETVREAYNLGDWDYKPGFKPQ